MVGDCAGPTNFEERMSTNRQAAGHATLTALSNEAPPRYPDRHWPSCIRHRCNYGGRRAGLLVVQSIFFRIEIVDGEFLDELRNPLSSRIGNDIEVANLTHKVTLDERRRLKWVNFSFGKPTGRVRQNLMRGNHQVGNSLFVPFEDGKWFAREVRAESIASRDHPQIISGGVPAIANKER